MIEPATSNDLAALLELETCFEQRWSEESWRAELDGTDRFVAVVRDAGRVVAAACFHIVDETADLDRIVVAPARRRQGLAAKLMEAGLDWAAAQGATKVLLEVEQHNEAAIELYRRYCFAQIAVRKNYYGQGKDALVMMHQIAPAPDGAQTKEVRA